MNTQNSVRVLGLRSDTSSRPILVKKSDKNSDGISHIHLPGETEYEKAMASIMEIAENLKVSFEDAAINLGYEVGFAIEHFSV